MSSFKIVLIVGILFAVQTVNARPSVLAEEKSPGGIGQHNTPGWYVGHEERKIEAEANSPGFFTAGGFPHEERTIEAEAKSDFTPGGFPHEERKIEAEAKSPGHTTVIRHEAGGFPHEERKIEAEANSPAFFTAGWYVGHEAEGRTAAVEVNAPVVQGRSETPGIFYPAALAPGQHERSETPIFWGTASPNGHENPGIRTVEEPKAQAPCSIIDGFSNC